MSHSERKDDADRREIEEALLAAELDAEQVLVSDYAARKLDAATAARVRERLERDPALADEAAPLLLAWQAPPRLAPLTNEDLTRAWLQLRRRAAMPPVEGQVGSGASDDVGEWLQERTVRGVLRHEKRLMLQAAMFFIMLALPAAGIGIAMWRFEPEAHVAQRVEMTARVASSMRLPDNSTVTFTPGARLTYLPLFEDGRRVYLEGEASFDVVEGEGAFTVVTPAAEVVVEGTSFQVRTTPTATIVTVRSGVIRLVSRNDDPSAPASSIRLTAGGSGRAERNGRARADTAQVRP